MTLPVGEAIAPDTVVARYFTVAGVVVGTDLGLLPGMQFVFMDEKTGETMTCVVRLDDADMERAGQHIKQVSLTAVQRTQQARRRNLIPTPEASPA